MNRLILFFIICIFCSCSETKIITGPVTSISGDTITVNHKKFVVEKHRQKLGNTVTFIETRNHKKVNAKKIN